MRNRGRGFTLIEIMVVVILLAIVGRVVVVGLRNDGTRVVAGGRIVLSELLFAQNEAITRQHNVYVVFQSDGSGYDLRLDDQATPPTPSPSTYLQRPGDRRYAQTRFSTSQGQGNDVLRQTQIGTIALPTGASSPLVLKFDVRGQPSVKTSSGYADLTGPLTIPVTNLKAGTDLVATNLKIQPFTGDISVDDR